MNKIYLLSLLAFVIIVSGCTIPGFGGGGSVQSEYENDIVIIKDQHVFPESVKASQKISLVTYVQNLAERNPDKFAVSVDLYDNCGIFSSTIPKCPTTTGTTATPTGCKDIKLLPKETKEISWTLTPDKGKVKVPIPSCKLKVAVSYPYKTVSQTEIYFIDAQEARRQQEQGTFKEKDSVPQKGEGPIVAYIIPDTNVRQPIFSDAESFPVSLYVENKGSGFLTKTADKDLSGSGIIVPDQTAIPRATDPPCLWDQNDFKSEKITIISKKSPPYPCQLEVPSPVPRELTKRLEVTVPYTYEFRKESAVTIEPS